MALTIRVWIAFFEMFIFASGVDNYSIAVIVDDEYGGTKKVYNDIQKLDEDVRLGLIGNDWIVHYYCYGKNDSGKMCLTLYVVHRRIPNEEY